MQQEIEELVNKGEIEIQRLKKELYHLQVENGSSLPQLIDLNIKEEAIIHIGVGRFDYKINTSTPFEDFDSFVQSVITRGTTKYGFDLNGFIVWLKDDTDLKLMYHYYFSSKNSFIHIKAIKKPDSFKDIRLTEQFLAPNSIPLLYVPANETDFGIFLYFADEYSFDEEKVFFKLLDPAATSISFTDSDGDKFTISTETDWNYFLAESLAQAQRGQYMMLKGESQ